MSEPTSCYLHYQGKRKKKGKKRRSRQANHTALRGWKTGESHSAAASAVFKTIQSVTQIHITPIYKVKQLKWADKRKRLKVH